MAAALKGVPQKGSPKSLAEASITIRSRNWKPQRPCVQRISHVVQFISPRIEAGSQKVSPAFFKMGKHVVFSHASFLFV